MAEIITKVYIYMELFLDQWPATNLRRQSSEPWGYNIKALVERAIGGLNLTFFTPQITSTVPPFWYEENWLIYSLAALPNESQ